MMRAVKYYLVLPQGLDGCCGEQQAQVRALLNEKKLRAPGKKRPGYYQILAVSRTERDEDHHPWGTWPSNSQNPRRLDKGTLQQKVWNAIRLRDVTALEDLDNLLIDNQQTWRSTSREIASYIKYLEKAGYAVIKNGRCHLLTNTGPTAPRPNKQHQCVFDPNTWEWLTWLPKK